MNPLNLYSALLLILIILLLAGRYLLRRGVSRGRLLVFGLIAVGVVGGWFALRPVQTPHQASAELRSQIGAGTPVLLEFQSPY
jgi:hypothetical protein